jgi:cytochrome c peroxidase
MKRRPFFCVVALWMAALAIIAGRAGAAPEYVWSLPQNFPRPRVPAANPMSEAKAELGRYLFYDTRLSGNGTQSCATCHQQEHAFADNRAHALGSTGEFHPRGSMSLVNVAYAAALTWANPSLSRLEDQVLVPMFGEHPTELGLQQPGTALLARLRSEPRYQTLFARAFDSDPDPFSLDHVTQALATFERTIISARSPYDRYHTDRDDAAISEAARRGETLFFSQPLSCFRCHGGFTFSGAVDFEGRPEGDAGHVEFHNTGLYNLAGALSYPMHGTGVHEITGKPEDVGKFKAPTLPNIAVTAPYMHDGRVATLEAFWTTMRPGTDDRRGPNRGVGRQHQQGRRPRLHADGRSARRPARVTQLAHRRHTAPRLPVRGSVEAHGTGDTMTLSARNHLQGTIEEIQYGGVLAHVTIKVAGGLIESVITKRSAEEMKLKEGDSVTAVVKATEVMIAKP